MNAILAIILSTQFIFLSLFIAVITYVVRTVIDYAILDNPKFPGSKNSRLWRSLILPLMPIMFGVCFSLLAKKFPYDYPQGVDTENAQFVFCLAAAALSQVVFKVVKELLLSNLNQTNLNPYNSYTPYINISQTPYPMPNPIQPPPYNPAASQIINDGHGIDQAGNSNNK